MTDKLANDQMVEQRVLNEVNIHCDKGLRHPSIVRVCVLSTCLNRKIHYVST